MIACIRCGKSIFQGEKWCDDCYHLELMAGEGEKVTLSSAQPAPAETATTNPPDHPLKQHEIDLLLAIEHHQDLTATVDWYRSLYAFQSRGYISDSGDTFELTEAGREALRLAAHPAPATPADEAEHAAFVEAELNGDDQAVAMQNAQAHTIISDGLAARLMKDEEHLGDYVKSRLEEWRAAKNIPSRAELVTALRDASDMLIALHGHEWRGTDCPSVYEVEALITGIRSGILVRCQEAK